MKVKHIKVNEWKCKNRKIKDDNVECIKIKEKNVTKK